MIQTYYGVNGLIRQCPDCAVVQYVHPQTETCGTCYGLGMEDDKNNVYGRAYPYPFSKEFAFFLDHA